ncbi:NAD(P)/FAD-dependent oxidoreductase [Bordetella avium]|uniref:NAD(P)/FAD-dependent oxidoreductase n=1 Tax=Bordetella avium TaxID=521 RepID=UPI0039FCDF3F
MTIERCSTVGHGVLIIGAGQAGATAANALRQFGFEGSITLIGDEDAAPYERPPLSKAVLLDPAKEAEIAIHSGTHYKDHNIAVQLGVKVAKLEPQHHRAVLTDGQVLEYSRCLLATGGRVRELPGHPAGATPNLHYLRTLSDAHALREKLHALAAGSVSQDVQLLVLGAGFLGLEVASTALQLGVKATVIEPGSTLLARAIPPELSQWLAGIVRAKGVDLRLGVGCGELEEVAQGVRAQLSDGTALTAACVVAAVGQRADTAIASEAGLQICAQTGGVMIDAAGRTSAPDVYAAGDCTTQWQPLLNKAVRLESWQSANEQARLAAASMLGKQVEPAATPWFWTDMFGLNIQMMGMPHAGLTYSLRGVMPAPESAAADGASAPKFLMFGLDALQRLRYAVAVNAGGDLRMLRPLFTSEAPCANGCLSDGARPLREITRQLQAMSAS